MSISHQYKPFRLKNSQKLLFFWQKNRGKQTKSKHFLKNRQTWCWNITYFSNLDIRSIGKKLDYFKVNSQMGVGGRSSDPSPSCNWSQKVKVNHQSPAPFGASWKSSPPPPNFLFFSDLFWVIFWKSLLNISK